jgi:hypothetical protein
VSARRFFFLRIFEIFKLLRNDRLLGDSPLVHFIKTVLTQVKNSIEIFRRKLERFLDKVYFVFVVEFSSRVSVIFLFSSSPMLRFRKL